MIASKTLWMILVSTFIGTQAARADDALYRYQGQTVSQKDLTPAEAQTLHEINLEHFMKIQALVNESVLGRYLDARAKKEGKSREDLEASLLTAPEATDQEAQKWFDSNKARLPPQLVFDQVKGEIKSHMQGEKVKAKRDEMLALAKKESKVELLIAEPEAPTVALNVSGYPTQGPKGAKLQLVEFADYQCPHCKAAGEVIARMLKKYPKDLGLTFVDFPINASGISLVVAYGAVCAEQQGKYWEYHDLAFKDQQTLTKDSPAALAKTLKLDEAKFKACMDSGEPKKRVDAGKVEGDRIGVNGTPALYLNGRRVMRYEDDELTAVIEKALKAK